MAVAQPYWERAEHRLRRELGDGDWKNMTDAVFRLTHAALKA